jgi:hypothetical protein
MAAKPKPPMTMLLMSTFNRWSNSFDSCEEKEQ